MTFSLSRTYADAGASTSYTPAMMQFDGASYYLKSITTSGNKVAFTGRFRIASFTGGGAQYVVASWGPSYLRGSIFVISSDHATPDYRDRIQFLIRDSADAVKMRLISPVGFLDNQTHTFFAQFDGDAGTATWYIDGADADDTGNGSRTAPAVATLNAGASSEFAVGATPSGTLFLNGELGFVGHAEKSGLSWSDFMDASGNPLQIDEGTASPAWAEWNGQPLFWNEHGDMTNNLGSAGAMPHSGLLLSPQDLSGIVVGKGGN